MCAMFAGCRRCWSLLPLLWAAAAATAEVPPVLAASGSGEHPSAFDLGTDDAEDKLPVFEQVPDIEGFVDGISHLHGDQHPLMTVSHGANPLVYRYNLDDTLNSVELTVWIWGGVVGFQYLVQVQDLSGETRRIWESLLQAQHHHDFSGKTAVTCSFPVTAVFSTDPEAHDRHDFLIRIWDKDPGVAGEMLLVASRTSTFKGSDACIAYVAGFVEHGRWGFRMPGTRSSDMSMRAVNWASQEHLYFHDSLLERMPLAPQRVDPRVITEHTGLKVPMEYDCAPAFTRNRYERASDSDPYWTSPEMIDVLGVDYTTHGADGGEFDAFDYYRTVPSRWVACHNHQAHIRSGQTWMLPAYPIVDEEYVEMVAVYEMALNARGTFSIVEVGARWGTWGFRAAAAVRAYNPAVSNVNLFFVEPNSKSCEAIHEMARINDFFAPRYKVSVTCQAVDSDSVASVNASLRAWAANLPTIDIVDLDCQGCEFVLVPAIFDMIEAKVHRVILGVHAPDFHPQVQALRSSFAHWRCVHEVNYLGGKGEYCQRTLWGPFKWQAQQSVEERCSLTAFDHGYVYGPMINYDGALIADNPALISTVKESDTTQQGCVRRKELEGHLEGEQVLAHAEPAARFFQPPSSSLCEIDFNQLDWDPVQKVVKYPWRISMRWRFDHGFVVRQVVNFGGDEARHPKTVCLILISPGEFESTNLTTKCDLFALKDAGLIGYGIYESQVFIHECDPQSCLPLIDAWPFHGERILAQTQPHELEQLTRGLGNVLCESSRARVSIHVPPKPAVSSPHPIASSFAMPPWTSRILDQSGIVPSCLPCVITEKRAGDSCLQAGSTRRAPHTDTWEDDQVIRIPSFHGRLGNVLIQLGVAFVIADKLGANVVKIPLNEPLRSSVGGFLGTGKDGVDPTDPGAEELRYFFPELSDRIELPVKSSGRWKGEIPIEKALDFVLHDEATASSANGLNLTMDGKSVFVTTDNLWFFKQSLLHPFSNGLGEPFPTITWVPCVIHRMFQLALLPTLRSMPEPEACRAGAQQAKCRDTEEDLVVHFRSGDIWPYRSTYHNFVRKHLYQPPLAFYVNAIETHLRRFPNAKIVLVSQVAANQQNLCIEPILRMYPQAHLSSLESASESFATLVGAKHLVLSRSTFSLMAFFMAPNLASLYSPELPPARWQHAPFDHFHFAFPGFHDLLHQVLSSDWRLEDGAVPLDFDERLVNPILNYHPDSVECKFVSDESG